MILLGLEPFWLRLKTIEKTPDRVKYSQLGSENGLVRGKPDVDNVGEIRFG